MSLLNKESPLPLYLQLKQVIEAQVATGSLAPHARVPSERELSLQFAISRMTVRQALAELIQEGRLYTRAGKGTFVSEPKIMQNLQALTSFTEDMHARGQAPTTRLLRRELRRAPESACRKLRLPSGTRVLWLQRLRLADNKPMALESAYLAFAGVERLLRIDLEESLYALLRRTFGIIPAEALQEFEARLARPQERALLQLSAGAPVLILQRTTCDTDERPFEFVHSVYRGDRYRFSARLIRRAEE